MRNVRNKWDVVGYKQINSSKKVKVKRIKEMKVAKN